MSEHCFHAEIAVVGGGPAGLAAACAAAEGGRCVLLINDTPWLGGQIWRGQQVRPKLPQARRWLHNFRQSGAAVLARTSVIAAPAPGVLLAERDQQPVEIHYQRLVLATGARELFLPFPGWTLPGVMGPGGLLALAKSGWPIRGRRVVVAGSGPLLLAAAEGLRMLGARVVSISEQASRSQVAAFALHLWSHPAKLWQALKSKVLLLGVPYRFGTWPVAAEGDGQVQRVTFSNGQRNWTEDCDLFACGFGLTPNVELPRLAGCALGNGFVAVDQWQASSVAKIYCAGEPTGIGGADCALVEGQIAGYAAGDCTVKAQALFASRAACHGFRARLATGFALRPELKSLARDDTILCRCEDVELGKARRFTGWREAKLHSRCGMGPCQGRVCGAAAKTILSWEIDSVRPPVLPANVGSLVSGLAPDSASMAPVGVSSPAGVPDVKTDPGPGCTDSSLCSSGDHL